MLPPTNGLAEVAIKKTLAWTRIFAGHRSARPPAEQPEHPAAAVSDHFIEDEGQFLVMNSFPART